MSAPFLYIHIPFCGNKCPYCSFAVAVGQEKHEFAYLDALEREASGYASRLTSLYIGGGTPSCLSLEGTERLMALVRRRFSVDKDAEISFEMNPESVTLERARLIRRLGVNRVSLGAQSLNDKTLEALGRSHRGQDVSRAFDTLRTAGFDNINLDLIYGLPGQGIDQVREDLNALLALGSEHLSLYALNIEERSLFFARKMEVDNDAQGEIYNDVCRRMEAAGVRQYEVSNFARPGFESRHNIHYWMGGEYIGLGMAAHSHLNAERSWNVDTLPKYLELMAAGNSARAGGEKLLPAEKLVEEFLFALRMNKGVDLGALEQKFGMEMASSKKETLESFIEMGLLEEADEFIRATARGRLLLDELSARLV